jgi:hypothetical protein
MKIKIKSLVVFSLLAFIVAGLFLAQNFIYTKKTSAYYLMCTAQCVGYALSCPTEVAGLCYIDCYEICMDPPVQ